MTTLSSLLPPANLGNATGTLAATNGGTGLTSPGASGNVLTSTGTGWASAAPPPSAPTLDAIASGSLSDGSTVIVNADGTVSVVAGVAQAVGTAVVFESALTSNTAATYDANAQKVVIVYTDGGNSSFGTAIVGTVSGTSISFGTAVVFNSTSTTPLSATYDTNAQKVVVALSNGNAIVGTVSGTSISFGTPVSYHTSSSNYTSLTYDANAQKVVVAYMSASDRISARVGTVSGTSISFGTPVEFENFASGWVSAVYDSTQQKIVIAYSGGPTTGTGSAIVGTVSGTDISFGTRVSYTTSPIAASKTAAVYDSAQQKVVIAAQYAGDFSTSCDAIVGTVSGTSISFGARVSFRSASTSGNISAAYDANAQKVVITYAGGSNFGTARVGTVSGSSISFGNEIVFESANTSNIATTYDSGQQKVVIAYRDAGNSNFGTSVVFQNASTNLTAENFIGFSDGAYTNGQTATVQVDGAVDDAQSGLTPGQSYFVQLDGSLGLTPASPSVFAGTAVSATKIIVKG